MRLCIPTIIAVLFVTLCVGLLPTSTAQTSNLPPIFRPGTAVIDPNGQLFTVAEVHGEWIRLGAQPDFVDLQPARWMHAPTGVLWTAQQTF